MENYTLYLTDTTASLRGDGCSRAEWAAIQEAAGLMNPRRQTSYAVWDASLLVIRAAKILAREQGIALTHYQATGPILDDGRIAAALEVVREAMAERTAKIAAQGSPRLPYPCAGRPDGCHVLVTQRGDYCPRCAHGG